ncbi:hypothetical protein NIES593_20755 [Hydrococcus rivularis NIES-593]|uniref:Uncharacterized protein n=1 Tax=Hydrococcus rivularis NIES-593 TaxID=1921803 RepID=A0A1U7H8J9_9CYAN|nr:hypothetical protein [Hydrococcus rivularis]OKH19626.1 hypothetical protein NIES593_20755 [Hydrococcus rivularis NIES-593]
MAGFFGLFGNKAKYVDEISATDRQSTQKSEAFFLDSDDAKSLGNVEFMRKAKVIKRTFPKTLSSQGGESIEQISSLEKAKMMGNGSAPVAPSSNGTTPATQATQAQPERRSSDSSMDMFRKMARELKK